MKKVLHVLSSNIYSGAENVACYIAQISRQYDFLPFYASPDGAIKDILKSRNIPFFPYKKKNVLSFLKVIKKVSPDIIHAHDYLACFLVFLSGFKGKMVFHIHKSDPNASKTSLKSILFLIACKKANHIFWVSENSFSSFRFKNKIINKSSILNNVIDSQRIRALSEESVIDQKKHFDAIFIGRMEEPKNPLKLVSIIDIVANKNQNFQLALIGSGSLLQSVKEEVKRRSLQQNITFLGYQHNPLPFLRSSKVLVLTSLYEGTPMVALEALCLGKPIISTPVGGMQSLVVDDYNGFLVDNNDLFSFKLSQICCDDNLRNKFSQNSYSLFKSLNNEDKYKKNIMSVYEK